MYSMINCILIVIFINILALSSLCVVFGLRMGCMLFHIVIQLPTGKNPFAIKINNNSSALIQKLNMSVLTNSEQWGDFPLKFSCCHSSASSGCDL